MSQRRSDGAGFVFARFQDRHGPLPAALLTTVFFWLFHVPETRSNSDLAAWSEVCGEYPKGGTPAAWVQLDIPRLGVVQDDLDDHTTSPVKQKLIEYEYVNGKIKTGTGTYKRWWPVGETRTLQLEGLEIEDVVQRVQEHLEGLTDFDVYRPVIEDERLHRLDAVKALRKARRRLKREES
jgi:hypothetical protein